MEGIQATCRDLLEKGTKYICAKTASFNRLTLGEYRVEDRHEIDLRLDRRQEMSLFKRLLCG